MVSGVSTEMPFMMTTGGNNDNGYGGQWIWAIVLMALLGNRGFGGDCGGYGGGNESVRDAVDTASIQGSIDRLEGQIQNGFNYTNDMEQQRWNYKEVCETHMGVLENRYALGSQIAEAKFDNAIIAKDAELAAQACCCETNRHIDRVEYEMAQNTCAITSNADANTQKILDTITQDKIESLRDELTRERLANSQCAQNAYLVDKLGYQEPKPAYISYPSNTPIFPPTPAVNAGALYGNFAGNNSGCGCGYGYY